MTAEGVEKSQQYHKYIAFASKKTNMGTPNLLLAPGAIYPRYVPDNNHYYNITLPIRSWRDVNVFTSQKFRLTMATDLFHWSQPQCFQNWAIGLILVSSKLLLLFAFHYGSQWKRDSSHDDGDSTRVIFYTAWIDSSHSHFYKVSKHLIIGVRDSFGGRKCLGGFLNFRLATVFCLEYLLSKHKMTRYSKNAGVWPHAPPWLRLWYGSSYFLGCKIFLPKFDHVFHK